MTKTKRGKPCQLSRKIRSVIERARKRSRVFFSGLLSSILTHIVPAPLFCPDAAPFSFHLLPLIVFLRLARTSSYIFTKYHLSHFWLFLSLVSFLRTESTSSLCAPRLYSIMIFLSKQLHFLDAGPLAQGLLQSLCEEERARRIVRGWPSKMKKYYRSNEDSTFSFRSSSQGEKKWRRWKENEKERKRERKLLQLWVAFSAISSPILFSRFFFSHTSHFYSSLSLHSLVTLAWVLVSFQLLLSPSSICCSSLLAFFFLFFYCSLIFCASCMALSWTQSTGESTTTCAIKGMEPTTYITCSFSLSCCRSYDSHLPLSVDYESFSMSFFNRVLHDHGLWL